MGKEAKLRAMRQVLRLGGGLPVSVLPGAPRCSRRCMVLALRREWWRSARRAPLAAELTDAARARLAPPPRSVACAGAGDERGVGRGLLGWGLT